MPTTCTRAPPTFRTRSCICVVVATTTIVPGGGFATAVWVQADATTRTTARQKKAHLKTITGVIFAILAAMEPGRNRPQPRRACSRPGAARGGRSASVSFTPPPCPTLPARADHRLPGRRALARGGLRRARRDPRRRERVRPLRRGRPSRPPGLIRCGATSVLEGCALEPAREASAAGGVRAARPRARSTPGPLRAVRSDRYPLAMRDAPGDRRLALTIASAIGSRWRTCRSRSPAARSSD